MLFMKLSLSEAAAGDGEAVGEMGARNDSPSSFRRGGRTALTPNREGRAPTHLQRAGANGIPEHSLALSVQHLL